jgi:hypothetical protein
MAHAGLIDAPKGEKRPIQPQVIIMLTPLPSRFQSNYRETYTDENDSAFRKFRWDLIHGLLGPAFTVAMLGAIESLMSAVVSDRMSNDRHNPNVDSLPCSTIRPSLSMCWARKASATTFRRTLQRAEEVDEGLEPTLVEATE